MSRKLPPLNAIRAFEAAARHGSITKAAEELHVTQSAVSHQVKALEDWLQMALFRRSGRVLKLTDAGEYYADTLGIALDQMARATRRLQTMDARSGWLTVHCMPSFATKWLVPRLGAFRKSHEGIDVWINTTDIFIENDLRFNGFPFDEDIDVFIAYGDGRWDGVHAVRFMEEVIFPVCSPALLSGEKPLRKPADLKEHTLLHDDLPEDWNVWLAAADVTGIDPEKGPGFDDSSMVLQAAAAGQGVALGRSVLVEEDLQSGRLIKPFDLILPTDNAYYVVAPEGGEDAPKIVAFRNWLLQQSSGSGPAT